MKAAIRTDVSSEIGTGHFMRCLTLANALKQRKVHIHFVSRHLPRYLRDILSVEGHEFTLINSPPDERLLDEITHTPWLGISQEQDAENSVHALSRELWDWLIVDHYALDFRWESRLRGVTKNILVIDDIADRNHDCDILLDQNYCNDAKARYVDRVPAHCQLLLGPRYGILREEFMRLREQVKTRSGDVRRILVFLGGIDANNDTGRVVEALTMTELSSVHVDVVIGTLHPCRESIEEACARSGFVCHVQTDKMAELMATADMAIGAVGGATLERCSMGVPSVVLVLSENQRKAAVDLDEAGVLINLGDAKGVSVKKLKDSIESLINSEKLRSGLSEASLKLVSMLKENNVAEIMIKYNA